MKFVLLAAITCLLSLSVFGQNQALMVDTNWRIVQTNTNTITFRQAIGFGTNTANQEVSRTNLGLTAVGNAVATATNTTAAQNAIGISATNTLIVSNIDIRFFDASAQGFVGRTVGRTLVVYGTNVGTATPAFYGWDGFANTAFLAGTARTNLGLGSGITTNRTFVANGVTNSVTISNGIITGWTQ